MSRESSKLSEVLYFLDQQETEYILVGENATKLMESVESDVDIVVSRASINRIHAIVSNLCETLDMQCVQILQHEQRAFYFVVAWIEEYVWHYLRLDFCDDYLRNARSLMTADELLVDRIKDKTSGFYLPTPEKNLLYYLSKKVDKGTLSEKQFCYITRNLADCREDILSGFCRFWTMEQSRKIVDVLSRNDRDEFKAIIPELQHSLRACSKPSFQSHAREINRLIKRILHPTGVWIAVYGPDGCGKSAVIEQLKPAVLPAFRQSAEYHFRPYVGYPENDEVITVSDPHRQKPRHPITSVLKLFYYATDYIIGYGLKVLPAKLRSTFVVFDRYYDDLIVDPRRYCYGGPKFLLKWLRPFIPKPDLVFCLDASAEVLQARKQEVSFEETARQREIYRSLVSNLRNGHVIDASQPLEAVVHDVQRVVLEYMEARTRRRMRRDSSK